MQFSLPKSAVAATLLLLLSACGSSGAPAGGLDTFTRDGGSVRADGGSVRADGGSFSRPDGGTTGGSTTGGSTTGGSSTCAEIYDCAANCGAADTTCLDGCYNNGSTQAQGQVDALETCVTNRCSGQSGNALQTCANTRCGSEMTACFGGGSTGGTGTSSCMDVIDCLNNCTSGDTACEDGCFNAGTASAQQIINDLATCLNTNCGSQTGSAYQTCAQQRCSSQITSCQNDGTGGTGGTGSASCGQVVSCLGNCASSDQTCANTCVATGTSAAQSELQTLDDCLTQFCANETTNAGFNTCANRYCASQIAGCEGLAGGGTPTADGGTATADGGTRPADGGTRPADGGTTARDGGTTTCTDTWTSYARGFFTTYCTRCHSAYSTLANVRASTSQSRIASGNMPRGSTLPAAEKTRILAWFACGAN